MKKHEHAGGTRKAFDNPREILLTAGLGQGKTLLDIGTGTGYLALAASSVVGEQGKVYALDVHAQSIAALEKELTEKGITNVEPMTADAAEGIPLPEGSVDVCLLSNVLHGFVANEELEKVMGWVTRVLREEGELVIIDFHKRETPFGPSLSLRLGPQEVEDLIAPFGYVPAWRFEAGPWHYAVVMKRVSGK
ncbi:MAG: class I SAM-dependent methyltransferase [Endomicrobiales bacterium]